MGFKNIMNRVFMKDKNVVILGLDNAGKSTMVSFLQQGTFIEHTPTMGKDQAAIEVHGIRINLIDMGGQKDFRTLWLGEMNNAQCVIFMVDAADPGRFKEAKSELWKLSDVFKKRPLIVISNKYDLQSAVGVNQIIDALCLNDLPSFEVLSVSCKTGFGLVKAFAKIYFKLTGKTLSKKLTPKAVTIYDRNGTPITTKEGEEYNEEVLKGGLIATIADFVKDSYDSDLNSVNMHGHIIVVQKSKHLIGSIVIEESEKIDINEAVSELKDLLEHLENMCPELEKDKLDSKKLDFLVQQYVTNLL